MIKNCYIHIPFCKNICTYCDFCKMYYNKKMLSKYLDALEKEVKSLYKGELLETIYIGGGTPNSLDIDELERLFHIINYLNKIKDIEFTFEGNIDCFTKEKLILLKKYGVNRLSIGIESINKKNLKYLGRSLDKNKIIETIKLMRELGFSNINVDLIYAIPSETINELKEDISFILSLDIEHISTYSLMIEDNTMLKINGEVNISDDLDYLMYKEICSILKDNNYIHYEISNFSKNNYFSKHNLCYWNNREYYGFGLGASSYIGNKRIMNTRSFSKYIDGNYIKEIENVMNKEIMEYQIILNLRKKEGISLIEFRELFGKELINCYDYTNLVNDGLLCLRDKYLFIDEDKWYISNEIIVRLLGCEVL